MIVEGLINIQFIFLNFIISLIPGTVLEGFTSHATGLLSFISISTRFIPWDIVILCIGCIVFWIGTHLLISLIRFILDFIPFF